MKHTNPITWLLLMLFILMGMSPRHILAAPPYKLTINGSGIDNLEIWLAADEVLLAQVESGLLPDQRIDLPRGTKLVYEITWYFGRCWTQAQPCTEDPDTFTYHQSRYMLDTTSGLGYISHQSDLGAWAGYGDEWYLVSEAFNHVIQNQLWIRVPHFRLFPEKQDGTGESWCVVYQRYGHGMVTRTHPIANACLFSIIPVMLIHHSG